MKPERIACTVDQPCINVQNLWLHGIYIQKQVHVHLDERLLLFSSPELKHTHHTALQNAEQF